LSERITEWLELGPHRFLEDAPIGVLVVRDSGLIVWGNRQIVSMFGYSRDELTGQPIEMLVPDDIRPMHAANFARWIQHPRAREMGTGLNIRGRNKNGAEMPLDIQLSPIETPQGIMPMAWIRERAA
jgi:PAS domain S-box-containing protein